ncbi:MAG: hypothetical protein AAGA09_01415 [Pseudomonadota bacterium]
MLPLRRRQRSLLNSIAGAALMLAAAACGRDGAETPDETASDDPEPVCVEAMASDTLDTLTAPPTGVGFWVHPTLAFNSLLIVAGADGVVGYNIEDGTEAARFGGAHARGLGVSYIGRGPDARGVLAIYDEDASAVRLIAVDNISRAFTGIDGAIALRGNVRGICFGRAADDETPSLHVIQKGKLTRYDISEAQGTITADQSIGVSIDDSVSACAVDPVDGRVFLAGNDTIFRLEDDSVSRFSKAPSSGDNASAAPMAMLTWRTADGEANGDEGNEGAARGALALFDNEAGVMRLLDRESGRTVGVVAIDGTDQLDGVSSASALGAASANLGGLYRNGALAFATAGDPASLRLAPMSSFFNALSWPLGDAFNPRGDLPETEDDALAINPVFSPQ